MRYTRDLPEGSTPDAVDEVKAHVRAHLSGVASEDDDPESSADDVRVIVEHRDGRIWVTGELDTDPIAPYLLPGWDPEEDVRSNPLTVWSILDEGGERS